MSVNLIGGLVVAGLAILAVFFMWNITIFPRKRRLKFKIVEKKTKSYTFYKALVKRGIYGWMGFNVYINTNSIWGGGSWTLKYDEKVKLINDYLSLCGRNKKDYDVTVLDKTTGKK